MSVFRFDFGAQGSHTPTLAEKTDASSKDAEAVFLSFDSQASSLNIKTALDSWLQVYHLHRMNVEDPLLALAGLVTEISGRDTVKT